MREMPSALQTFDNESCEDGKSSSTGKSVEIITAADYRDAQSETQEKQNIVGMPDSKQLGLSTGRM